ncbi:MAG TPA: trehalose-6-phosphate synthase, partial [Longimicrobiales bacterium]|nr:trehalose-6-phosphate synthase [Longimicrobiales bacterium]
GKWRREPGAGGLVSALEPVLRRKGGTWVGWPGVLEGEVRDLQAALEGGADPGYRLVPVSLTDTERRDFYRGFANEILWPLCHGLPSRCNFEARYWQVYRRVNRKFAEAIGGAADGEDLLWIHDYHLMAAAEELREAGLRNAMGFFLHIPFPPPDIFEHLPWADEVLESLLHYDVVGLQTDRDRENLLSCVRVLRDVDAAVADDGSNGTVTLHDGRRTRVCVHPISIDNDVFAGGALRREIEMESDALRSEIGTERILLGVDRLDYTKGIPEKLLGLERALERYPDLLGRVTLVQLVIPSREMIPEYERMKDRVERLVGRINGRFTDRGWAPVLYRFGTWDQERLLAFYRAADVALVTPLRDGMNLVSKEFCAASVDGRGVLILSCFAGSADELRDGA